MFINRYRQTARHFRAKALSCRHPSTDVCQHKFLSRLCQAIVYNQVMKPDNTDLSIASSAYKKTPAKSSVFFQTFLRVSIGY